MVINTPDRLATNASAKDVIKNPDGSLTFLFAAVTASDTPLWAQVYFETLNNHFLPPEKTKYQRKIAAISGPAIPLNVGQETVIPVTLPADAVKDGVVAQLHLIDKQGGQARELLAAVTANRIIGSNNGMVNTVRVDQIGASAPNSIDLRINGKSAELNPHRFKRIKVNNDLVVEAAAERAVPSVHVTLAPGMENSFKTVRLEDNKAYLTLKTRFNPEFVLLVIDGAHQAAKTETINVDASIHPETTWIVDVGALTPGSLHFKFMTKFEAANYVIKDAEWQRQVDTRVRHIQTLLKHLETSPNVRNSALLAALSNLYALADVTQTKLSDVSGLFEMKTLRFNGVANFELDMTKYQSNLDFLVRDFLPKLTVHDFSGYHPVVQKYLAEKIKKLAAK